MRHTYIYKIDFYSLRNNGERTGIICYPTRRKAQEAFDSWREHYQRTGATMSMSLLRVRETDGAVACLAVY